jgi:hypothetical protein
MIQKKKFSINLFCQSVLNINTHTHNEGEGRREGEREMSI